MNIRDILKTTSSDLTVNKGRSFLTVLGIVIGIAAIIIVMSVGDSAKGLITNEIQSFGPQNVFVNPGHPANSFDMAGAVLSKSIVKKDIDDLKNKTNVPDAILISPSVTGFFSVAYGPETRQSTIWGTAAEGLAIYNLTVNEGRLFTKEELDGKASVTIIGKNVAKELFGLQNPIGEKIKIKEKNFLVVGVFSSGNSSFLGIEDMVVAPYTTVQQYLMGIKHFHEIAIQAKSAELVPGMVEDIKTTLRNNHNIDDPDKDDFIITTQEDLMKTIGGVLDALTVFLALVAAISLIVGGVGVMNIMFVSVTERTQEIGLRKSIGATNKDILTQFLIEAVFLTGIGGVIGVLVGSFITFSMMFIASQVTGVNFPFIFSITGALLGIAISGGAGLVFGVFPARQASRKSPMEALRYE
ncbi:MAG TPA: ABC transporter permease [Candidatus Paceibacterota bacterium]|nr:ABC transporter permease [Candidatus Paceibacterota bacterium]